MNRGTSFVLCWNYKVLKPKLSPAYVTHCFVLCWNYKVLKQRHASITQALALYSVEITRFSSSNLTLSYQNSSFVLCWNYKVLKLLHHCRLSKLQLCTLLKLQGSQADSLTDEQRNELCTLLKLQGSQAETIPSICYPLLCTLLKLQGSQATTCKYNTSISFVLCWNYKVLKLNRLYKNGMTGFVLCWNYKVLKLIGLRSCRISALYSVEITRFSS